MEQINTPIFLEAVLAMQEPQSNLEEKVNPSILKDDFSTRTDPHIFISIAPVLLTSQTKLAELFQHLNQQAIFCQPTVSHRSDS